MLKRWLLIAVGVGCLLLPAFVSAQQYNGAGVGGTVYAKGTLGPNSASTTLLPINGQSNCSLDVRGTFGGASLTAVASGDAGAHWQTVSSIGTSGVVSAAGLTVGPITGYGTDSFEFQVSGASGTTSLTYTEKCSSQALSASVSVVGSANSNIHDSSGGALNSNAGSLNTNVVGTVTVQPSGGSMSVGLPFGWASSNTLNLASANAFLASAASNAAQIAIDISGLTASGATLTFEATADASHWRAVQAFQGLAPFGAAVTTATADGTYHVQSAGYQYVRVRVSSTGTGTATIASNATIGTNLVTLAAGTSLIGSVNQGTSPWVVGTPAPCTALTCTSTIAIVTTPLPVSTPVPLPTASPGLAPYYFQLCTTTTIAINGATTVTCNASGQQTFNLGGTTPAALPATPSPQPAATALPVAAYGFGIGSSGYLPLIECDNSIAISVASSAVTQLVALSAGKRIFVCGYSAVVSAASNVQFFYGTGTNCATGQATLTGAVPFAANGGIARGPALVPVWSVPAGNALCASVSAGSVFGDLQYAQM